MASFHSFRFISLFGLIPNTKINRLMRNILWHSTLTDTINDAFPFSNTFTFSYIHTLMSEALK